MDLDQSVENFVDNLGDYHLGTMRCIDELLQERRTNRDSPEVMFYTPQAAVYSVDKEKSSILSSKIEVPTLRITRENNNPILRNHFCIDIFHPVTSIDFEVIKAASDTVTIDFSTAPGVDGILGTADDIELSLGDAVSEEFSSSSGTNGTSVSCS